MSDSTSLTYMKATGYSIELKLHAQLNYVQSLAPSMHTSFPGKQRKAFLTLLTS